MAPARSDRLASGTVARSAANENERHRTSSPLETDKIMASCVILRPVAANCGEAPLARPLERLEIYLCEKPRSRWSVGRRHLVAKNKISFKAKQRGRAGHPDDAHHKSSPSARLFRSSSNWFSKKTTPSTCQRSPTPLRKGGWTEIRADALLAGADPYH